MGAVGEAGSWFGLAALRHSIACVAVGRELAAAVDALGHASQALNRFADRLDEAQQDARRILGELDGARASVSSLEDDLRGAQGDGVVTKLLGLGLGDARAWVGTLEARLAETHERADIARREAAAAFEDVARSAPLALAATGGPAGLDPSAFARDPQLAPMVDVIAAAGRTSSTQELREQLNDLDPEQLTHVLESAPGLAYLLTTGGLPQHAVPGTPVAVLQQALATSDPAARIDAVGDAFAGFSPEEATMLALLYPTVVGNLNGAPLDARIAANRVHVVGERARQQEEIARLEARADELQEFVVDNAPQNPGARYMPPPELYELAELREQLEWENDRLAILDHLADDEVPNPRYLVDSSLPRITHRQMLVFDPRGDGTIAELHGVIDQRTRDIGVLVPGTGADLNGFQGIAERGLLLTNASEDRSLATISWLGYDAPDSVLRDAPFNNYADASGPALRDFVSGIPTEGRDVTVVGHSYGGAVVGVAEREGMVADNIVHLESAGMSIDDPSQYPHEARRYSLTAPGDPIEFAQGAADADVGDSGDNFGHGLDPDTFPGVTRLETGRFVATDPTSPMLRGLDAHGDVWVWGSDAWNNVKNVMTGGEVTLYTEPEMQQIGDTAVISYPMEDPNFQPPKMDVP